MGLTISYLGKSITLSDYIEHLIDIAYSNARNITKDGFTFIDGRYKGLLTIERGFQTIIKVADTKSVESFKYIKTYQVANDEKVLAELTKSMEKLRNLPDIEGVMPMEDFYIENNRKAIKLKMFVIEDYVEYISLQDFLSFLSDDYSTGKVKLKIENLYNELTKMTVLLYDTMEQLNKNHGFYNNNMRISNLMLCRGSGKTGVVLKLTDTEVGTVFSISLKDKKNQLPDLQTIDNDDYHNLMILLLQVLFVIKNLSFGQKGVFEFSEIYRFYETDLRIIEGGIDGLISEETNKNKLLYLNLLTKFIKPYPKDLKEVNECYKLIEAMASSVKLFNLKYSLDLLFSLVDSNEDDYLEYFFKIIYDYELRDQKSLVNYIVTNSKLQMFIAKYVSFISTHYKNNRKIGKNLINP
jgi:hypothetical protein